MRVMNRADNTSDKNPTTMTMKGIRGRLVRILATGSDVMCGCSEQEGKLVLRKKVMSVVVISQRKPRNWKDDFYISIYFENNVGVAVNVKGDEGFGDHENSKSRTSRMRQTAVLHATEQLQVTIEYVQRADGSVVIRKIHTVVSYTQRTEPPKTVRSKEVAGYSGPDADWHSKHRRERTR